MVDTSDNDPICKLNPNLNYKGSLRKLPQAPLDEVPEGDGYNRDYNTLMLQGHNTYRRAHQVCDNKFSAEAARLAQ